MSQLSEDDFTTSQSQAQSKSAPTFRKAPTRQTLDTVPEDTQEPQSSNTNATSQPTQSKKRKAASEDEEMAGVEEALAPSASRSRAGSAVPPSKKQAVENVNAVEPSSQRSPKGKTGKASGAPPGKPDTDPVFLKAVASTKRSKKAEDDFDREFNKLKITKPELDRVKTEPEDQWAILNDFGDERDIRGNFMVVVEMDVYKDRFPQIRNTSTNPEWEGKPNFKKFKQVCDCFPLTWFSISTLMYRKMFIRGLRKSSLWLVRAMNIAWEQVMYFLAP